MPKAALPQNRSMPPHSVIPVLGYPSPEDATNWLTDVLGFRRRLVIGGHRVQLSFDGGSLVVAGTRSDAVPARCSVMLRVGSVGDVYSRALDRGAMGTAEPTDYPYGERQATFTDPWGHVWTLSQTIADSDPASWGGQLFDAAG
ncbi:MAG TPA: VOC family protein [Trueperaceae bacterium]